MTSAAPYITRFAPSPTGHLHLGHAFSALTAFQAAKDHGGTCLLRIEDIDHTRCRPHFEEAICEDLRWLGLDWPRPVLRQSTRTAAYEAAIDRLRDMGVLYACYKTRKELMLEALGAPQEGTVIPADTDSENRTPAWRLSLEAAHDVLGERFNALSFYDAHLGHVAASPAINGDVVLSRKDIGFAYHLAVVVDDAFQGVTHIHRGLDLLDATHTQVLLQALLDLPTPSYAHHRLILDETGQRLAKRKGSKSLQDFRQEGLRPSDIHPLIGI
jgi:glutamyl-Q tRNA(Asp) synthetase